jgi:hypothetical protein
MLLHTVLADKRMPASAGNAPRWQSSFSFALALVTWLGVTWHHTPPDQLPLVLAAEGVLLTLSYYLLRIPEIPLLSQAYVVMAQAAWVFPIMDGRDVPPWWSPALLIAMTLGLSHWWQKQKTLVFSWRVDQLWQAIYAAAVIAVLFYWLSADVAPPRWLALSGFLAIAITAYGVFTRSWFLAAFGQFFVVVSAAQFIIQLGHTKPNWMLPFVPIVTLGFLSWATWFWFQRKPDPTGRISQPLLQIGQIYRWVALLMSLLWVGKYSPRACSSPRPMR